MIYYIWAEFPQSTRKKPTTSEFAQTCWKSTRRFKNNILLKIFFSTKILWPHQIYFIFPPLTRSWTTWHGSNSLNFRPISSFFSFFKILENFWKNGKIRFFVTIIFFHFWKSRNLSFNLKKKKILTKYYF